MGAFLALILTIIVFVILIHSHERIKNKPKNDEKINNGKAV
jgi:hypothetical protein